MPTQPKLTLRPKKPSTPDTELSNLLDRIAGGRQAMCWLLEVTPRTLSRWEAGHTHCPKHARILIAQQQHHYREQRLDDALYAAKNNYWRYVRAEQALHEAEARIAALLDTLADNHRAANDPVTPDAKLIALPDPCALPPDLRGRNIIGFVPSVLRKRRSTA